MRHSTVVIVLLFLIARPAVAAGAPLPLSSLIAGCSMHTTEIGLHQQMSEAALLQCGGETFIVRLPANLIGHVKIDTPEKALEFVRFFTSPEHYMLFDMHSLVEVVPGNVDEHSPFNVMERSKFARYLQPASAKSDDAPCKPELRLLCGHHFEITRSVAGVDNHIDRITESVYESGVYVMTSRTLIVKDAAKLGIVHFGDL